MSIRVRAALYTLGIFATCVAAGVTLHFVINTIPGDWWPTIGIGFLVALGFNLVYSVVRAQLQYQEKLKEIVDQK